MIVDVMFKELEQKRNLLREINRIYLTHVEYVIPLRDSLYTRSLENKIKMCDYFINRLF